MACAPTAVHIPPVPASSRPLGSDNDGSNAFGEAAEAFLAILTPEHQSLFSPVDFADLKKSAEHILSVSKDKIYDNRILRVLGRLHNDLEPYFLMVGNFVPGGPELAAFVWGAIRLVLQLASNFATFFERLTTLLESLTITFQRYGEFHQLCTLIPPSHQSRIPFILKAIYDDVFEILRSCVQIFSRHDGSARRPIVVMGSLIWKPFDYRFKDRLSSLCAHHKALFEEISVSHVSSSVRDAAQNAAQNSDMQSLLLHLNELGEEERENARKERELVQKERELRSLASQEAEQGRRRLDESLLKIQWALQHLESDRMKNLVRDISTWLSPPRFTDAFDQASFARQNHTASWIFQEDQYKRCLEVEFSGSQASNAFGPNVLWIHGHPGAGKTVVAASIVEGLKMQHNSSQSRPREVYYFFFDYRSSSNNNACSAYRSLLSQILVYNEHDQKILDKFSYLMHSSQRNLGQLEASKADLTDLLDLSLSRNSFLVLDGIDECTDGDDFIAFLLQIWKKNLPHIIFLSRVNVASLKRNIQEECQLQMSKDRLLEDIQKFSDFQLQHLFDTGILPPKSLPQKPRMVDRMVHGSNGMFLWARLMVNFLRSPYLDQSEKMNIFNQIDTPEGLEAMYSRIVHLILASGERASTLASNVLLRLIHAPVSLSSRHLRQSLVAAGLRQTRGDAGPIRDFEDSVIIACAGLVERTTLSEGPSVLRRTTSLRLIHLSVNEILSRFHSVPSLLEQPAPNLPLITDKATASLDCATTCLKQLLYHTPHQPLSGALATSIDGERLYRSFCFADYAAVSWLLHLESFITVSTASMFRGTWSPRFQKALCDFTSILKDFLHTRAAVSVWLEAFYSSAYQEIFDHPSLSSLDGLALWARQAISHGLKLPFDNKLIMDVESFRGEVHNAISIWGTSLRGSPCTIWDEMTAFMISSRFFRSSQSTEVTYQQPTAPSQLNPPQEPAASMSKTSESGEFKAVLSIWGNKLYHDESYKELAWVMPEGIDLTELCSGWVVTCAVWKIQPATVLLVQAETPIQPCELLTPMRNYFNVSGTSIADLPMAINSQLNTFAILGTLFTLQPSPRGPAYDCLSCTLPLQLSTSSHSLWIPPSGGFPWPDLYSTTFSDRLHHLALVESKGTDQQRITVCQYTQAQTLDLQVLNVVNMERGVKRIEKVFFHPLSELIAFCGFSTHERRGFVFLWAYRGGSPKTMPLIVGKMFEAVGFSSCGKFFLTRLRSSPYCPDVLEIPPDILDAAKPLAPTSTGKDSPLPTEMTNNATLELASERVTWTEVWKVDGNGNVSSLATKASESDISITRNSHQGIQTEKLVRLPIWKGASETTQRVIPPQFQGDCFKISVDVDTQGLSPHSVYQLSKAGGAVNPAVIYRDPQFIAASNAIDDASRNLSLRQVPQDSCMDEQAR